MPIQPSIHPPTPPNPKTTQQGVRPHPPGQPAGDRGLGADLQEHGPAEPQPDVLLKRGGGEHCLQQAAGPPGRDHRRHRPPGGAGGCVRFCFVLFNFVGVCACVCVCREGLVRASRPACLPELVVVMCVHVRVSGGAGGRVVVLGWLGLWFVC